MVAAQSTCNPWAERPSRRSIRRLSSSSRTRTARSRRKSALVQPASAQASPASGGKHFSFDVSAMFANDGHADTEPQPGAAARAFGGVKGIEDARKRFWTDADAVVLNGDRK